MSSELGTVRTYNDLRLALRHRAVVLGMSRAEIDERAGLPDGYTGKILGEKQIRSLGLRALGPMLGALKIELVVRECEPG